MPFDSKKMSKEGPIKAKKMSPKQEKYFGKKSADTMSGKQATEEGMK